MEITLPLSQMTVEEKLRVMETIWVDLTGEEANVPSPPWHHQILLAREASLESGAEKFTKWEAAKSEIRKRFK